MPIPLWAILAFAVFLISTIALSGERSLAALAIQKGAVIAALTVPVAWVVFDAAGAVWRIWQRLMSRPYT